MRHRATLLVAAGSTLLLAAAMFLLAAAVARAAEALPMHPSVAAQPVSGRYIKDMAVKDGRLYVGHGNYSANTGPVDIAYYDLATGTPGVALSAAPTEEINTFRADGGNLFAPWIDPKGCGTCSPPNGGMTNDVAGWHNENLFPAAHVYDYTRLGSSEFLVGAASDELGAGVWRSDNDGPWQLVRTQSSRGGATGWERFYWAVTLGGKVYVQAKHNGGTTAQPSNDMFPMYSWDGSRWRKVRASVSGVTEGHQIEVFKDRAYFGVSAFDGRSVTPTSIPVLPRDWFVDGSYLYAVSSNGTLVRTDGAGWTTLGQVALPSDQSAYSVAVAGGVAYVGTNAGVVVLHRL